VADPKQNSCRVEFEKIMQAFRKRKKVYTTAWYIQKHIEKNSLKKLFREIFPLTLFQDI
jgi:hypothetical protein